MYITGRHDRLFEFFPKTDDLPVDILQILFGIDISIPVTVDHKLVVSKRLDFIIIINSASLATACGDFWFRIA